MIFKINKNKNYIVMSNYHLKEKDMSLKSKGLLSLMLSLPPDWDYSINGLISICKENETSIKSSLDELKKFGYLEVIKLMPNETETGRIEYVYNIYEIPKQGVEKQGVDFLGVEFLDLENQGQLNIEDKILNNKDIDNILEENYNKRNAESSFESDSDEELFNKFWKEYPKKVSKEKAKKWFIKNKPSEELVNLMIKQLKRFKTLKQWKDKDGQYIPYPSSWLNAHSWEDEFETDEEKIDRIFDKLED